MVASLEIADTLPDFQLGDQEFHWIRLSVKMLGKPAVILFYPDNNTLAAVQVLRDFAKLQDELADVAHVFAINNATQPENAYFAEHHGIKFPILSDEKRDVAQSYGVAHNLGTGQDLLQIGAFTSFVTGPDRRLLKVAREVSDSGHAKEILQLLRERTEEAPQELRPYAPVLYVRDVLEPAFCQRLITAHESGDTRDSGVFRTQRDGTSIEVQDPELKLRRDHFVTDAQLKDEIQRRFARRIVPEAWKAFHFPITRFEEFKVVCYDASTGGYFGPHRDNIDRTSAHRRFAVTLNLNSGDFEGGHLRFPEYGPHLYRPGTGDAVVFSCSLLHEALPVTEGRRFVLLAFLFGENDHRLPR